MSAPTTETGTTIHFLPDADIFESLDFEFDTGADQSAGGDRRRGDRNGAARLTRATDVFIDKCYEQVVTPAATTGRS